MPDERQNPNQRNQSAVLDEQRCRSPRDEFAVAMATGQKVSAWAKKNGVPLRTCYNWRQTRAHQATVQHVRRHTLDRAVGQFAHNLRKAAGKIMELATAAESESVQLRAARAVLIEYIAGSARLHLNERLTAIEAENALQTPCLDGRPIR